MLKKILKIFAFFPEIPIGIAYYIYDKLLGKRAKLGGRHEDLKLIIKSIAFYETFLKSGTLRLPYNEIEGVLYVRSRLIYTLIGITRRDVGTFSFMTAPLTKTERVAIKEMLVAVSNRGKNNVNFVIGRFYFYNTYLVVENEGLYDFHSIKGPVNVSSLFVGSLVSFDIEDQGRHYFVSGRLPRSDRNLLETKLREITEQGQSQT